MAKEGGEKKGIDRYSKGGQDDEKEKFGLFIIGFDLICLDGVF
jgi:hypothetical protein